MTDTLASPAPAPADPHAPVVSLDDLVTRVRTLVPVAVRRQLWTLFLDSDDVQLPLMVPLDGVPEYPDRVGVERWGDALDEVAAEFGVSAVVFVLERPGPSSPSGSDLAWRAALAALPAGRRWSVRAVLSCSSDGVAVLDEPGPLGRDQSSPRRLRISDELAVR